mgnify:CR=1 FL=1
MADAEGQGLDKSTQAKMENDATTRKNRLSARETSMTGLGIRPRTPPLSPSSQSYAGTDRLSVLSATATDLSDFSPSPTASIGSVRIATVTRVPCRAGDRRVSTGMASIASEDGYLSDASLTLRGMGASGERAIASSASRLDAEPELREDEFESGTKKHHESRAATRLATSKWQRGLSSSQNRLSSDEWAARPGSSQSSDHTGRQSMSILGEPPRLYTSTVSKSDSRHYLSAAPVTRVLSPPPWVEAHGDENVYPSAARPPRRKGLTASRSLDLLGKFRHPHSHDNEESKADRLTYNATTLKESTSSHKRSASEAPLSRISPANTSLVTARPLTLRCWNRRSFQCDRIAPRVRAVRKRQCPHRPATAFPTWVQPAFERTPRSDPIWTFLNTSNTGLDLSGKLRSSRRALHLPLRSRCLRLSPPPQEYCSLLAAACRHRIPR